MAERDLERRLARVQREQHGVFARLQGIELGVPAGTIDGRVRIGRYVVLLPGVYCEAGTPVTWLLRASAAVLWAGGDAVVARQSALHLHGLPVPGGPAGIRLLVRNRCFVEPPGVRVHRTRRLPAHHVTRVSSLPVTTVARTVCDVAAEVSEQALRRVVAAAARTHGLDATAVRTHLAELGRVRGATALRRLADELSPLEARCRSELEARYLRLARANGIEPTAMNHPVRDQHGRRRFLDAVHLPERLPVEIDSDRFHTGRLDRNDDRARERDLAFGVEWHRPVRVTEEDLVERPGDVVRRVRTALDEIRTGVRPPLRPSP